MKVSDVVWFRPATIGYGYDYGSTRGIPAVVTGLTAKRVRIEFCRANGAWVASRYVSRKNVEPRS